MRVFPSGQSLGFFHVASQCWKSRHQTSLARAGKRRVDGSGHTRRLGFSWLTKALLRWLVIKRLSSLTFTRMKSTIGSEMLGEATHGIHGSLAQKTTVHLPLVTATVRNSFDALRISLKKLPPDMLSHAMTVVSGSFCSQAFWDGQHHGHVMKFSPILSTKPGTALFGQTALPHLRTSCNIT